MALLVVRLRQLPGIQVREPGGRVDASVEAGRVRDAERRLLVVAGVAAAAPHVPLVGRRRLGLGLARLEGLAAHAARRGRRLRRRGGTLRPT